jgi:RNA polymerase sigma-70 factor, ECF subfamily
MTSPDGAALPPEEESTEPPDPELMALVKAARRGDRGSFAALHARHVRLVRGILMARGGTRDLDDRVQSVFASALEHVAELRDPAAFGGWLAQIARREATTRAGHATEELAVDEIAVVDRPRAEAEQLLARIRSLPMAYAEPLILRLVFGMTGPEVARELALSPAYVRVNLHRGMTKLRELLDLDGRDGRKGGT